MTDTDQAIVNACSNEPKTIDEIAEIVGRTWVALLGDLNRLVREKRIVRTKRWGKAALWRSYGTRARVN